MTDVAAALVTIEATYVDEYALAMVRVTGLASARARAESRKSLEWAQELARDLRYKRGDGQSAAELIPKWAAMVEGLRTIATAGAPGPLPGGGLTIEEVRGAIRGLIETDQQPTQDAVAEAVDLTSERVRQVERDHGGHRAIVAAIRAGLVDR